MGHLEHDPDPESDPPARKAGTAEQAGANSEARAEFVSASTAARFLGVKRATLYAYASRGLVQSVAADRGRRRLYRRTDLERLRARRDARAGHGPVAAAALRFGEPVLDSSITSIHVERGPAYRGREAAELARDRWGFEAVAEVLWGDQSAPESGVPAAPGWRTDRLGVPVSALGTLVPADAPPLAVLCCLVPLLAARDPGRFTERAESVVPRARRLIRRMAAALALAGEAEDREAAVEAALGAPTIASAIARALGAGCGEAGVAAIDQALVLGADHELNASTFAARIAASTGADVYAGVAAALACLSGPRHGGASDRVEALIAEIGEIDDVERVVYARQRRGEAIDGFRHPLYPDGDPRGATLIDLARTLSPESGAVRRLLALCDAMASAGAGHPNIDAGLVALALALGLPPGSAVGLFAIARSAGWVAHMLEQYEAGYLVRPRARYRPLLVPASPIGRTGA